MSGRFVSDRMLNRFTTDSEGAMDASALIEQPITIVQPGGIESISTWQALEVTACRASHASADDVVKFAANQESRSQLWRIVVPAGKHYLSGWRFTITIPARGQVPVSQFAAIIRGRATPRSNEVEASYIAEQTNAP